MNRCLLFGGNSRIEFLAPNATLVQKVSEPVVGSIPAKQKEKKRRMCTANCGGGSRKEM